MALNLRLNLRAVGKNCFELKKVSQFFVFFFFLSGLFSYLEARDLHDLDVSCVQVKFNEGADHCSQLQPSVDTGKCSLSSSFSHFEVECEKDRTAILRSEEGTAHLRLEFKKNASKGAWGASDSWTLKKIRYYTKGAEHSDHSDQVISKNSSVLHTAEVQGEPSKSSAGSASPWEFHGYFDTYYSYRLRKAKFTASNASSSGGSRTVNHPNQEVRYYDWYSRQLALNLLELSGKYTREETSLAFDLDFGQFADINASVENYTSSGGPEISTVDEVSKHIGQAVLTYKPKKYKKFTLELGKMYSHVGLEPAKPKDNWNYSRATLFGFGEPFWHTGFHVGYDALPGLLALHGYLYQGWNTIYETNSGPTFGAQIKFTPFSELTWIYNYIGGQEDSPSDAASVHNWKEEHETNVSIGPVFGLTLATSFLYGHHKYQSSPGVKAEKKWLGFQNNLKYQWSDSVYTAGRFEFYRDLNGYTLGGGLPQRLLTYTLTQSAVLSEGLEIRLEGRHEQSSLRTRFTDRDGGTTNKQTSILMAFLYTI